MHTWFDIHSWGMFPFDIPYITPPNKSPLVAPGYGPEAPKSAYKRLNVALERDETWEDHLASGYREWQCLRV